MMFKDLKECQCHRVSVSDTMLHIQYAQQIMQLERKLEDANRVIHDLAETNKYLSRSKP